MTMTIEGIGTAVPLNRIAQSDSSEIARRFSSRELATERSLEAIYRRSGVGSRHSVLLDASDGEVQARQTFYGDQPPTTSERMDRYERDAVALAVRAAERALADAGTRADRITHLITVSCTGFHAPGFDVALFTALPLSPGVARTHVGFMGCHGLMNATRVAKAFAEAEPSARILVCAVELCSLHMQYDSSPDKVVANALFADGAGAYVASKNGVSDRHACRVLACGSTILPDTLDAMSWKIGDQGFSMTLSSRVPDLIAGGLRPWLDNWLEEHGERVPAVGSWAVHPGGPRILAAFAESARVDRSKIEASYSVLNDYGNMSSPTILFILERLRRAGAPRPYVAIAFGPGLTVEAALLD